MDPRVGSDDLWQWREAQAQADADASGAIANDSTPAECEEHQDFAARLYQLCLRALQRCYRQKRDKASSNSRSIGLRECLERLHLWGESFDGEELDRALEQSDEVRINVLERLGHIGKILLSEMDSNFNRSQGLVQQDTELESIIEQSRFITSGHQGGVIQSGEDSDEDYDSGSEGSSAGGSYDLCKDISFTITCLTDMRASLEQNLVSAERKRTKTARPPPVSVCVSGPANTYISLVREKFKQAENQLVERLGEANWQRHLIVRKRMGVSNNTEEAPEPAYSVFRPYSAFHDSGLGTSVPAQTSYAPSHMSFVSSKIEADQTYLRVPPIPIEVGARKPFQCDFCGKYLSDIKNRVNWKMHVFADLKPYMCTFANCEDKLAQFPTRSAWADHEFTEHRTAPQWSCPECPNVALNFEGWEDHLQQGHQRVFTMSEWQVACMAVRKQSTLVENPECPLCRTMVEKSRRDFVKHVGRHMEEIALMALPRNAEDELDGRSRSSGGASFEGVSARPSPPVQNHASRSRITLTQVADTLYVRGLSTDASEVKWKVFSKFSKSREYKELYINNEHGGRDCSMTFNDASTATEAFRELNGYPLLYLNERKIRRRSRPDFMGPPSVHDELLDSGPRSANAKVGSEYLPWQRLTDWEMMNLNAERRPNGVMIKKELDEVRAALRGHAKAKEEAMEGGVELLDEDSLEVRCSHRSRSLSSEPIAAPYPPPIQRGDELRLTKQRLEALEQRSHSPSASPGNEEEKSAMYANNRIGSLQPHQPNSEYHQESRISHPHPVSAGNPTTISPKDALLDFHYLQDYANVPLYEKSTSDKGRGQQDDDQEQHQGAPG